MLSRFLLFSLFSLLITGCAAPPPPPMTLDNPTNADAAEAPLPSPSTTLNADRPPDGQPAADSMNKMHMQGGGMKGMDMKGMDMKGMDMKGMDMKGMDMKDGDQSMPGMQQGSTSRRSQ